jgi:hypothetical protein
MRPTLAFNRLAREDASCFPIAALRTPEENPPIFSRRYAADAWRAKRLLLFAGFVRQHLRLTKPDRSFDDGFF